MMRQNIVDIAASLPINMKTLEVFYDTGTTSKQRPILPLTFNMCSQTHIN